MGEMNAAHKRYLIRLAVVMAVYLGSLFLAEWLIEDRGVTGVPAYALASVPGLMVAAIFWLFSRLIIEEQDEYIRLIYVRQSLIATGFSMSLAGVWGFLETYKLIFHLEAFWWPIMWCLGLGIGGAYHWATGWYRGAKA